MTDNYTEGKKIIAIKKTDLNYKPDIYSTNKLIKDITKLSLIGTSGYLIKKIIKNTNKNNNQLKSIIQDEYIWNLSEKSNRYDKYFKL